MTDAQVFSSIDLTEPVLGYLLIFSVGRIIETINEELPRLGESHSISTPDNEHYVIGQRSDTGSGNFIVAPSETERKLWPYREYSQLLIVDHAWPESGSNIYQNLTEKQEHTLRAVDRFVDYFRQINYRFC